MMVKLAATRVDDIIGTRTDPGRNPQPRRGRKPARWTQIDRDYEPSASACKPSSTTSTSPPHRQSFVDPVSARR
jgi:hypothetical protein